MKPGLVDSIAEQILKLLVDSRINMIDDHALAENMAKSSMKTIAEYYQGGVDATQFGNRSCSEDAVKAAQTVISEMERILAKGAPCAQWNSSQNFQRDRS